MKNITIDLETKSGVDITKTGIYRYAEDPDFDILLMSVSVDGGEVKVYDIAGGEKIPDEILNAFVDREIIKKAFNVNFERICISVYLRKNYPALIANEIGKYLSPESWQCDMVHCKYLGLPSSLADVSDVFKLKQGKLDCGKDLIKYFCAPDKNSNFNSPDSDSDKWTKFKDYNKRDVEAEIELQSKIKNVPVPESVWEEFYLDQHINDKGILVDVDFAQNAIKLCEDEKRSLFEELQRLTGLNNPHSVKQMKDWLNDKGIKATSLDKKSIATLLDDVPENIKKVLILYQMLTRSSVKKYEAMINDVCADNRARGMFKFYGAARTGRFSGCLVQLQNLPQNHIDNLADAKANVKEGNFDAIREEYGDVTDVLSQLIRTSFIPSEGKKFIVADFSAIEARVIAWLAGEQWRLDAFSAGEDIYCTSAAHIFGVTVEKNGVNGHLRQRGKVAELACAYGGSVGAMKNMGGTELNLSDDELKELVKEWRKASPNIVKLWYDVRDAALKAVKQKCSFNVNGITIKSSGSIMYIILPSGRRLSYCCPKVGKDKFGNDCIIYKGKDANKGWTDIESSGAKLVENIVQAIARDLLLYAMKNISEHYQIVAHVHDEVIVEADPDTSVATIIDLMTKVPTWAEGLPLQADGYDCNFYKKA